MSNLAYLIGAVVFASLASVVLAFRHRSPTIESNVEQFSEGMRALKSRRPVPPQPTVKNSQAERS